MIKVTAYKITDSTRGNTLKDSSIKVPNLSPGPLGFLEKPGGFVVWIVVSLYLTRGRLRTSLALAAHKIEIKK